MVSDSHDNHQANNDSHSSHGSHHGSNQSLEEIVKKINTENSSKPIVKVLIIQDDNDFSDNYHPRTKEGYHFDVFKMLIEDEDSHLHKNYQYDIEYIEMRGSLNYNNLIEKVQNEEYDLILGGFLITKEREGIVNFSVPLYINRIGILHLNTINLKENFKILLFELVKIFSVIILIALCFGLILYYVEPFRNPDYKKKGKESKAKKEKRFRRHMLTMIASFFGEMGFLSENSTLTVTGMFFTIFSFIFIFILLMIVQARITTVNLRLESQENNIDYLKVSTDYYKPFLAKEGNAEGRNIEILRPVNYVDFRKESLEFLVLSYFNEPKKYGGIVMLYTDAAKYLMDKDKNYIFSMDGFGLEPTCWVVTQHSTRLNPELLLEDINIDILKHRTIDSQGSGGHLTKICKKYIKEKNACLS